MFCLLCHSIEKVERDCARKTGPCASDPPCWCRSVGVSPARDEASTVPHYHTYHPTRSERQVQHD